MDETATQNTMHRMRLLFITFVVLLPVGVALIAWSPYQALGITAFSVGGLSGIVCAFTTCPCCGQLSGVFFKGFFGGAFPIGSCVHCKKSYLRANGCNSDS
jgi:hypothetical protein